MRDLSVEFEKTECEGVISMCISKDKNMYIRLSWMGEVLFIGSGV